MNVLTLYPPFFEMPGTSQGLTNFIFKAGQVFLLTISSRCVSTNLGRLVCSCFRLLRVRCIMDPTLAKSRIKKVAHSQTMTGPSVKKDAVVHSADNLYDYHDFWCWSKLLCWALGTTANGLLHINRQFHLVGSLRRSFYRLRSIYICGTASCIKGVSMLV
jgi:hypothetical protein